MTGHAQDAARSLHGLAAVADVVFLGVEPPDPLAGQRALRWRGQAYNLWLTSEVLEPAVAGWRRGEGIRSGFAAAARAAEDAFGGLLPGASAAGDPAVLAALGVTANLQRTLALLAEFLLDERPATPRRVFRLSRHWAGLVEYPPDAPYFPARPKSPAPPAQIRPNRRDPRHLCNALWCAPAEVKLRCAEALDRLRREARRIRDRSGE